MTMNWIPDRPTKPGEYWLAVHPDQRGLFLDEGVYKVEVREANHVYHHRGMTRFSDERLSGALWAPCETPPDPFVKPEPKQYVILDSRQIVGNCAMFWRPDGAGYTCDLNDAGLYEKTKGRRDTDIYVPIEVVRSMAVTHVRVEPLKRAGYWSKPQPKDTRTQRCEGCSRFVKRGGWLCAKCAEKGW